MFFCLILQKMSAYVESSGKVFRFSAPARRTPATHLKENRQQIQWKRGRTRPWHEVCKIFAGNRTERNGKSAASFLPRAAGYVSN